MKKVLFILAVFCFTATFVSAQVENAADQLTPAAKAAAADASITSKSCGKDGSVCYMKKGEGDAMNVVKWDVEQGKFVNLLDKEGKQVTCSSKAKTCSSKSAKSCAKTCSSKSKKSCAKSSAKGCSHAKGAKAKTCSGTKAKAKTCSHGAKGADAKGCAPGCDKACCAKDAGAAHKCEPGCTKECCAKKTEGGKE